MSSVFSEHMSMSQIKDFTRKPESMKASKKKPPLGSGKRFATLKSKLAQHGASNPGGLAAFLGRKSLGKAKFQSLAKKGKARASKSKK